MSLNTKPSSSASSHALAPQKSDLIKAELAKYRLLKSKGVLGSHEEAKENHPPFLQNQLSTIQSPSRDELSQSSVMALLQLNSSHALSKNEYYLTSSAKPNPQPSPSTSEPSTQAFRKSFGGPTSDREPIRAENYSGFASVPGSKVYSGAQTPTTNKSLGTASTSAQRTTTAKKKNLASKSITAEERQKQAPLNQIEDFNADSDIERDLLSKVYPSTTHHTSRTLKSAGSFSKSQTGRLPKEQSPFSRRTGSNVEITSKELSGMKKFGYLDSPKEEFYMDEFSRKDNSPAVSQSMKSSGMKESRERKTAAANMEALSIKKKAQEMLKSSGEGENEDNLKEEIDKWRIFGKMMAESYDDLNKRYTEYMKEKEKDKKIVNALREQITTLKALLQTSKEENMKLKDMSSKSTSESSSRTEENLREQREIMQLTRDVDNIRTENKEVVKMVDMLKLENQALKKALEESHKQKDTIDHYRKLADTRFKECSALAEEIICLRTDLDRSHSNYLRIQREQSSGKKGSGDVFYSAKKNRQEQGSFMSGANSATKPKKLVFANDKKGKEWNEDFDDLPPSPEVYNALPSKEENLHIRG